MKKKELFAINTMYNIFDIVICNLNLKPKFQLTFTLNLTRVAMLKMSMSVEIFDDESFFSTGKPC